MFFEFIVVIMLIGLIVSHLLLARKIQDKKIIRLIEKTNLTSSRALTASQTYITSQKDIDKLLRAFDEKMKVLAMLVDDHFTSVVHQQELFSSIAQSDMLSARREELRRLKELKIALERLMGVALTSRQPSSPNDVLALENIEKRIEELETILEDKPAPTAGM